MNQNLKILNMTTTPEIRTPPIILFGDVVLLQGVIKSASGIVLPDGAGADSPSVDLYVALVGDGERVRAKLKELDRVELVHLGTNPHRREYNGVVYLLVGLDNILGVRTD